MELNTPISKPKGLDLKTLKFRGTLFSSVENVLGLGWSQVSSPSDPVEVRYCSYIQAPAINSMHAFCQEQPSSIEHRVLPVCSGGMCFLSGSSPQRPSVVAGTVSGGFGMKCNQIRCGGVNAESSPLPDSSVRSLHHRHFSDS